jgi:phosphatidylserine/phosphatidylglycerophosphate/cardiolipin synthase-like enzyme
MHAPVSDADYIWEMCTQLQREQCPEGMAPELAAHVKRMQSIGWKLRALEHLEQRLKAIRSAKKKVV